MAEPSRAQIEVALKKVEEKITRHGANFTKLAREVALFLFVMEDNKEVSEDEGSLHVDAMTDLLEEISRLDGIAATLTWILETGWKEAQKYEADLRQEIARAETELKGLRRCLSHTEEVNKLIFQT